MTVVSVVNAVTSVTNEVLLLAKLPEQANSFSCDTPYPVVLFIIHTNNVTPFIHMDALHKHLTATS